MNWIREIARTLARMTPESVLRRLKDDAEFATLADLSGVSYGKLGVIYFEHLIDAISRATASPIPVEITNKLGHRFNVECDSAGVWITPFDASFVRMRYPEFDLLGPNSAARVGSFRSAAANCWPWLPSKIHWEQVLQARPPSEQELVNIVTDIRINPRQHLSSVSDKLNSGVELSLGELLPTARPYYEALVRTPAPDATLDEWIQGKLFPLLAELIENSLLDGLKCALTINIDPRLSPAKLLSGVSDAELVGALGELIESRSPLVVMGVLEVAAARSLSTDKFWHLALDAFHRLFGQQRDGGMSDESWQLLLALVGGSLRSVSTAERMCTLPIYWRRIAAFASASVLMDALMLDGGDVDRLVKWIADAESTQDFNAALLDMAREPLWTHTQLDSKTFRRAQLRRLVVAISAVDCEIQPELARELLRLVATLPDATVSEIEKLAPGPLPRVIPRLKEADDPVFEILDSTVADVCAQHATSPLAAWNKLVGISVLGPFTDARLLSIATLIEELTSNDSSPLPRELVESLAAAAEVSAKQASTSLSGAVTAKLLSITPQFSDVAETEIGLITLIVCSGAIETAARNEWLGSRLAEYAYVLPRGEASKYLLARISSLERLLPLDERSFSVAKKLASSVIG